VVHVAIGVTLVSAPFLVGCSGRETESVARAGTTTTSVATTSTSSATTTTSSSPSTTATTAARLGITTTSTTGAPTSTLFEFEPTHLWLQGKWEVFALRGALDGIADGMEHDEPTTLRDALPACVEYAGLSATYATGFLSQDEIGAFHDIATTCDAMVTAAADADDAGLTSGRTTIDAAVRRLDAVWGAMDDLMSIGDANESDAPEEGT